MRGSVILISLAVFLLGTVVCDFNVWSPHSLVSNMKSTLPLALANFGHTPYGKSLSGNIHLAHPRDACTTLKHIPHDKQQTFVIAKYSPRDCNPVTQAQNAEAAGAKMLILVYDQNKVHAPNGTLVDVDFPNLDIPDDGMGHNVKIPTIVIEKTSGDAIINYIETGTETVTATAKFDFTNQTSTVKYSLWMSSASKESIAFLKAFHKFHNLFGNRIEFTPKFVLTTCFACNIEDQFKKEVKSCLSGGRYCAPDHGPRGVVDGRQVVHEDLRMTCIWKQDNSGKSLYRYIERWDTKEDCTSFKGHECSHAVMSEVGINVDAVKKCVKDSFKGENHLIDDNTILEENLNEYKRAGLPFYPALTLNNKPYHGNLRPATWVFEAVCSAYKSPPEICTDYYSDAHKGDPNSGAYTWIIIVISAILIFFLVCMIVRYKSSLRAEMMRHMESQVSTQVSQYYAMKGEGAKASSG